MKPASPAPVPEPAHASVIEPARRVLADDPQWYRDAVIYQVHVRGFFDSANDGVGDFVGLTRKLDYIQSLGVSCIWLQPFYPSPLRDDGYDIAHYQGVHPSYGTLRDFRHFLDQAHSRNLRVITELVINHTSDQHPWFQAARRARPGSSKRDFYVWSDTDKRYQGVRIIFTDSERSNWTWDPVAGAYYWHRFFHHQPDLNFDNPQVRKALLKVMRFWLDLGVDGMRLDAVPYLIEREDTICENLPETHAVLREIRSELDARYPNRMLLAEANQWPSDVRAYFGEGDECHMAFNFPLMPRLFMALRQEDRHPISEILNQTPDIPEGCQWAIFLRNHDELTLEMVTDEERDYMYQAYAADPQMRVNVGIRRRLAPLVENSRPRIELLSGLLLSLPGTPILYYGDEIGMGDNIYLGDRNGVRTPMQWSADRNGGFSRADPARLYAPVIMDSVYGYEAVNVEAQERSPYSLLNWMRRGIALRQQHRTFGRGSMEILRPENRRIFAFIRRFEQDDPILVVANLSRTMQPVSLDLSRFAGLVPVEMSGGTELPPISDTPYFLTLGPYAFYWILLTREPPVPLSARPLNVAAEPPPDQSPLLVGPEWTQVLSGSTRGLIERRYLGPFLRRQRWFGHRGDDATDARLVDWGLLRGGTEPVFLALASSQSTDGEDRRYLVPLAMVGADRADDVFRQTPDAVLARVAGARKGLIHGHVDADVGRLLLDAVASDRTFALQHGELQARRTAAFDRVRGTGSEATLTPVPSSAEQSNSSIRFGERVIMKVVRRLWPGVNPELELGRFLTEDVGFTRAPALAGMIEYRANSGEASTAAVLHALVPHQMDGWRHALAELERYLDQAPTWNAAIPAQSSPGNPWTAVIPESARATVGGYLKLAATLGRRTAELHLAFSGPAAGEKLGTARATRDQLDALAEQVVVEAESTLGSLASLGSETPADILTLAHNLIDRRGELIDAIRATARDVPTGLLLTRIHGDYHLGQVLLHEGDFAIVDFEGEPARSIEERRQLHSPLKDVAGMVRSFHYAAAAGVAAHRLKGAQDAAALIPWASWWQTWTTVSFLHAYHRAAAGALFLPFDPAAAGSLLTLFLLEKALYEVRYELAHRPAWLGVPLSGVIDLLPEATPDDRPQEG
jgi:maltose alpha-D-glucosyltransferase / alpha-amylase